MRWGRRGRIWWITRQRTSSIGVWTSTGNYEWVVLRTELTKQDRVEDADWRREKRWAYYDKQNFRMYRQVITGGGAEPVELIDEGLHGLAKLQRVPLFGVRIPEGLVDVEPRRDRCNWSTSTNRMRCRGR